MKLTAIAMGVALVGASSAYASPYYVGQNIRPQNNITLEFQDTVTKKEATALDKRGNIAAFELKGDFSPMEHLSVGANLPFFMANKNATGGESRNAIGNIGLSGTWSQALSTTADPITWGYSASLDALMPTSRKDEAGVVATANPTTDFYRYAQKTTTIHPSIGLFVENEMFAGKANLGYGYMYLAKDVSGVNEDRSRNSFTWQAAASWKALPVLAANLEYNGIVFDKATGGDDRTRHAISPSVSGTISGILASAFLNIPVDKATRDVHNVSFGLNAGYMF